MLTRTSSDRVKVKPLLISESDEVPYALIVDAPRELSDKLSLVDVLLDDQDHPAQWSAGVEGDIIA